MVSISYNVIVMSKTKIFDQDRSDIVVDSKQISGRTSRGTIQHGRRASRFDAPGAPRRFFNRVGAVALLTAGAAVAAHEVVTEDENKYRVDPAVIAEMTPEEIAAKYDSVTVQNGDSLEILADEFMASRGIESGRNDIISSLDEQAKRLDELEGREPDNLIQPGERYLLSRQ
jgi:hypothetical protein